MIPSVTSCGWGSWRVLLVSLIGTTFASACASPVHYYAPNAPALPAVGETHRAQLERDLAERLVASEIEEVELVEASGTRRVRPVEGRASQFEQFPLVALEAVTFGAAREARGAEFDLLVRRDDVSPGVIVTVRHDLDRRLVVLPGGVPLSLDERGPASAELSRRFGIGPLEDGDVAWSPRERGALGISLGLLTSSELAYLRGLPFRRDAGVKADTHAGYYVVGEDAEGGLVVLLDRAFELDGTSFVGTPGRAYPSSIAVILHEMAHAIARLDLDRLHSIYERDRLAYNEAIPIANRYVDALNERYALANRLDSRQRSRLERDIRTLEKAHRKNKALLRKAKRRLADLERRLERPSPMEAAYGELPGARRGPTPYGSTSVAEGFAEAFSLYHLDPESIRRISPQVHDWFAAGHHLSAALYPPLEGVVPPAPLPGPR
jgi:hypothetical protein